MELLIIGFWMAIGFAAGRWSLERQLRPVMEQIRKEVAELHRAAHIVVSARNWVATSTICPPLAVGRSKQADDDSGDCTGQ